MTSMAYAAGPGAERQMRGRAVLELAAFKAAGGLLGLFQREGFRPVSDVLADRGVPGQRTLNHLHEEAAAMDAAMAAAPAVQQGAELAMQGADVVLDLAAGEQQAALAAGGLPRGVVAESVHVVTD